MSERPAKLWLNSWAGLHSEPVIVIAETAKRYRIRVEQRTKIAGRDRWLNVGETALVPKHSVRFEDHPTGREG